ncbi:hypothetical protein MIND_01357500 [Mycena indigotica]|uniref:Uncharacterized protein n=1 Tax=Mycena indigotica TaxID=2126181 RepID=A0A8H6VQ03_9AGAR|nr:uncharacterized protein MIND_01357500 [Mycena indigotica]KAF7289832.1 hypothetical protein MIND_01357500 [Mycena indigotica]
MSVDVRALLHLEPLTNDDEGESDAITAVILSASQDENPTISLVEIYSVLCQSRSEALLDPLAILPPLLRTRRPGANDLISLVGECASAKEVVIAIQEALEGVARILAAEDDGDEPNEKSSPVEQLLSVVQLSTSAIPRLKLRRKAPSETLTPLLSQLERTIHLASAQLSRDQGRQLLLGLAQLLHTAFHWMHGYDPEDVPSGQTLLKRVLDSAVSDCSQCLQSSLAQRTFEKLYPRLTIRSQLLEDWQAGELVVEKVAAAYKLIDIENKQPPIPSVAYLVLLSHSGTLPYDINKLFLFLLPILISSVQTTHALDETLALLLVGLQASMFSAGHQLSPEISGPLCAILPSLASSHPDAQTRHQAFRILSRILFLTPPQLRIQILKDLVTDTQFPQMRVAAIGLVKESVLDALSHETSASIFASPQFLQVFGPILLRPDPLDLFDAELALDAMVDSSEPARLVECLSLYYILLLRDKSNRTGIRDRDQIKNVERTLLAPIRATLLRWMKLAVVSDDHLHTEIMPLVALKTSLERVDVAIIDLN